MKIAPVLLAALLLIGCRKEPAKVLEDAAEAMSTGDFATAEEDFRWLLERTPEDARLQANLAFALTSQGKHAEAIDIYRTLVGAGDGSYDLFAYYAKSLDAAGRHDDAIIWNYRALSVVPQLVDVRGDLAKLLVKNGRPFEALSLLSSFDDRLESMGKQPYFEAQRIAITSSLPKSDAARPDTTMTAVRIEGHFYTVAVGDNGESLPMMIDTGASHTTATRESLAMLGLALPKTSRGVSLQMADGSEIQGLEYTLPTFRIGPHTLRDVRVVTCEDCAALLGQSTLERFDLKTTRRDGLEVMTMTLRPERP